MCTVHITVPYTHHRRTEKVWQAGHIGKAPRKPDNAIFSRAARGPISGHCLEVVCQTSALVGQCVGQASLSGYDAFVSASCAFSSRACKLRRPVYSAYSWQPAAGRRWDVLSDPIARSVIWAVRAGRACQATTPSTRRPSAGSASGSSSRTWCRSRPSSAPRPSCCSTWPLTTATPRPMSSGPAGCAPPLCVF